MEFGNMVLLSSAIKSIEKRNEEIIARIEYILELDYDSCSDVENLEMEMDSNSNKACEFGAIMGDLGNMTIGQMKRLPFDLIVEYID